MHRPISQVPVFVCLVMLCAGLAVSVSAQAEPPPAREGHALTAEFLYKVTLFTEWPAEVGPALNLCLYGTDPLAQALKALQGKPVNTRTLAVQDRSKGDALQGCQLVYLANPVTQDGMRVLADLYGQPVLTVMSAPGAAYLGAALNLLTRGRQTTSEINLSAVRAARIKLSAKLLYLTTEVIQ